MSNEETKSGDRPDREHEDRSIGQEQLESKDANSYMPLRVEVEDV